MAGIKFDFTADNKNLLNSARQAQTGVINAINSIERAGSGIESTFSKIKGSVLGGFSDIAKGMAGLTALMQGGNFIKELIADASKFNVAMKEVSTLSEDVASNLQKYKSQVVDMTTQIPIEATEAAKAMYQIESAGHHGADGLNVLRESAKGAIGGVTDTATTADAITTILNAYKKDASEAQHVSDLLFTTVRLGKTNMSQLGSTIAQVAPVAASFGVSIEDVLAAIASLTKQGTKTSVAVRQVRDAITATTKSMGDNAFQGRSFLDAMDEVAQKAQGSNNALRQDLGTLQALNAVLALTGKNSQAARQDVEDMQQSAGAAEAAYQKMASNAGTQTMLLRNNIFKSILPLAEEMKSMSGDIARYMNEAFDSGSMDKALVSLEAFIAAYATYRGLLTATTAWNSAVLGGSYQLQIAELQQLIPLKELDGQADLQAAVAKGELTIEQAKLVASLRAETEARYEEILAAETEARANLKALTAAEAAATANVAAADEMVIAAQARVAAAMESGSASEIEAAKEELNTAERIKNTAATELNTIQRQKNGAATMVNVTEKNADTAAQLMNTQATGAGTKATGLLATAKLQLSKAIKVVNSSFLASPLFWIAATIAAVTYAVYKLVTAENAHDAAIRRANEAMDESKKKLDDRRNTIDSLIRTIQDPNATGYQKLKAYDELKTVAKDITDAYSEEAIASMDAANAQKILNESMEKAEFAGQEKKIAEVQEKIEAHKKSLEKWLEEYKKYANYSGYEVGNDGYDKKQRASHAISNENAIIESLQVELDAYQADYNKMKAIRDEAAENTKPLEIRIEEAKENEAEKKRIFDFFDNVMLRVEDIQSSQNNLNFDEAQNKLDAYISDIQGELDDLHQQIQRNPLDQKLQMKEQEKTDLLNKLLQWQEEMHAGGFTTIPLMFKADWGSAKAALNAATGFYQNLLTQTTAGGTQSMADLYKAAKTDYEKALKEWQRVSNKKNAANVTKAEYDKAKSNFASKKADFEAVGGDPDGKTKRRISAAQDKSAEDEARRRQKLFEADMKQTEEQARQKRELNDAIGDLEIANEQDNAKRELMQMQKDHEDKLEAIREQADQWKKEAYKAAEERWNATNKDKTKTFADTDEGKAGWQAQSLTEEQSKTEKALIETANADYKRIMQERYESQVQAMRDYMKEFGTFQEQKYAIEKEYDDKISKEQDEWRKKQLEDEKKKALDSIDVELLRTEIDWSTMFDGIGGALEDEMKATLEKIEKYMQTDAFKNLDAKEKSEFVKMRNDLYQKTGSGVGTFDFSIYGQIADDLKTYQQAVLNHKQALIINTEAINKLKEIDAEVTEAKKRLEKAVTEEEKRIAKENLDAAQQRQKQQQGVVIGTRNQVQNTQAQVVDSQGNVKRHLSEAEKALGSFSDALNQMSSGTLKGFADGIVNLIAAIGGKDGNGLAGLGKVGGIIGAIFSIIDALGDAPAKFFDDLFDKISTVIAAVIEQIPQIVVSVIKGAGSIIGSVATGFGNLFTNLFGGGPDNSEYKKALEKWGNILDVWRDTIDYQRELMEKAYGADVVALQNKSVEQLNKVMEAAKDQYLGWMNSGAGTWSHSHGHDINETANWRYLAQTDPEMLKWLGGSVWQDSEGKWHDEEVGDLRKLAEMDWKDLERFKNENAQFWATIHEDVRGYLETYIEAGKELEETMNIVNEKLTTTTKENVIDSFKDSLKDYANTMGNVTDSATEDWHKMVNEMVIDNLILKDMQDDLEKWYEDLAEVQRKRNNGEYASDEEYLRELENLNKRREQILQEGQDKVDEYREAGIIQTIDTEDAETSFKNLRDLYREKLLDMASDSEAFRKKLSQILAEDLLNSQVFDVKMTVNGQDFENFDAYAKDWNQRYADALKASDEAALDALINELVEQQTILQEAAENIRERLKETQEDTTFKDMADSWTSTLIDMTKTAEDWAQDIGRTMAEKIISQMVAPTMMQPLLDKLQEAFNTAMGADGATWKSVMADGGVLAALGAIKDAYPELQEVVKQIMEALGVTVNEEAKEGFSDLKGTIISALMDSEGDIKKFAADLGKGMVEQMVKAMTDQKYGEQIKALNEEWASALESGDPARIEAVKQKVLELYAAIGNDEEIKKLLDDIRELGASNPFDNLQDSFLSALMNMEGSADDFVKDLKKKLAEALVNDIVIGKDFADKLEYYKEQYKRIMGDPSLSDEERAKAIRDLADTWREYTEGKKQEADEINKWLGTYEHEDQQATMNMANAATYDQYELSLGMQTSQLMVAEQHKEISRQILETLQGMNGLTKPGTNYGEQIFMRLGTTNEYLLAMKKELIAMHSEFGAKFDKMNSNLNKL